MGELTFGSRLKHAWDVFRNREPTRNYYNLGSSYHTRPDRPRLSRGNERSIVTAVYNRIALDVAAIKIVHCKLDENDCYTETVKSGLNDCLNLEANIDQTGRALKHDYALSLMDEGCIAIVPVDTTLNPNVTGSYDILTMRTGRIIEWFPAHVKVRLYNEKTGEKEDVIVPKKSTAIIENPLYTVMNEPNSIMQRLIRKLNILDSIDEQSGSGKLDLIIQLPYSIRSEARRKEADKRRADIADQLKDSQFGIAYADATEKITQLNRPIENNLMKQIEYLTSMLYSQLGISQSVLEGTADEQTMMNYINRSVEPFVAALVDEMKRKFLTKTARSQRQSICYFRDPFKLVPAEKLANIADTFTRNEIMTKNEVRTIIGLKPSKDPKADMLINSNINQGPSQLEDPNQVTDPMVDATEVMEEGGEIQNG